MSSSLTLSRCQLCCCGPSVEWRLGRTLELLWFFAAAYQLINCKAWASVRSGGLHSFVLTRLSHPSAMLCPPQWQQCGCLLGVPSVEGAPLLLVCLQCPAFLFGCPGFVLPEEKFTDSKVEIFCYEKEYSSRLACLVFCLAVVKRILRHS